MRVELFAPCFVKQIFPNTMSSITRLLEKFGAEVIYNQSQSCCGQPAFSSGHIPQALQMAQQFLNSFSGENPIICPSASCAFYIREEYRTLSTESGFQNRCNQVIPNVFELTDFLVNRLQVTDTGSKFDGVITWHEACSGKFKYGLTNESRKLLRNVKKLEIIEMHHPESCCGYGGTFSIRNNIISSSMVATKVKEALETGAEYIASFEASCLVNIHNYIQKEKLPLKVIHIADILAEGI